MAERQAVVILRLGHCGAPRNEYELFTGTAMGCWDYLNTLPSIPADKVCEHCGGYTGTVPVRSECTVEYCDESQ